MREQMNNILEYMEQTAPRVPDKLAFAGENSELSFGQVFARSKGIGTALSARGYYREPVVVYMHKSPDMVNAFFGVVYSGCFYVPIDEEMPAHRIGLIFGALDPRVVICDGNTRDKAEALGFGGEILMFDDIRDTAEDPAALAKIRKAALDVDPIYIVFTSGSTGVPKGVVACHRSVIDYIETLSEALGFSSETVFGNQTPLYFDACLKELYPTLKFGATTYLIPKKLFMFPVKLVEYLNEKRINTVCWVVSALTMISAFGTFDTVKPEYLRTVAFGSEVFPIKQFNLWRQALPEATFTNLYGPTEATGMCCFYRVDREFGPGDVIPIGGPFRNTEILLLKDDNTLAAPGETGEICVRGTSVTLGYYNNPEKTAESFVQNPLNKAYPEIIYRTGDLARRNDRGELEFISRKDYQIKHMGHRIELGEIEAVVNLEDGIRSSCCIFDDVKKKIVLYYTGDVEKGDLSGKLRAGLPRYMLPHAVIQIDSMPFTPNGKIDRKLLKERWMQGGQ
ncbi:MAG: amino acid adenylation domain-containing protein [Clostridia bacterium]|nr:amino acid adenylation domain-containing protein [Clostridia bacterium]